MQTNHHHIVSVFIITLSLIGYAYAQTSVIATIPTVNAPVRWASANSSEETTINNGNGNKLTITIVVDKIPTGNPSLPNALNPKSPGINVKNCGDTRHVDAGSSTVCTTQDAVNPVSFSSDSPTDKATGTYTIKQI